MVFGLVILLGMTPLFANNLFYWSFLILVGSIGKERIKARLLRRGGADREVNETLKRFN